MNLRGYIAHHRSSPVILLLIILPFWLYPFINVSRRSSATVRETIYSQSTAENAGDGCMMLCSTNVSSVCQTYLPLAESFNESRIQGRGCSREAIKRDEIADKRRAPLRPQHIIESRAGARHAEQIGRHLYRPLVESEREGSMISAPLVERTSGAGAIVSSPCATSSR